MNSNDIKDKKFARSVGGYKTDDVNTFLLSVSEEFDTMLKEKTNLESKFVILADKLEEYRNDEESMRSALLGAQKLGDNIVKDSNIRAEEILENAQKEAYSITASAKADAERINGESKIKLESQNYSLNKMKREVSRFQAQVLALYKQHISLLEGLPNEDIKMVDAHLDSGPPVLSQPITTNFANSQKTDNKEEKNESKKNNIKNEFKMKD